MSASVTPRGKKRLYVSSKQTHPLDNAFTDCTYKRLNSALSLLLPVQYDVI